ncbi:hypothetical protein L1S32_03780 [Methanogenium sp. S4BF]|uniref:hypothetical protein n=1 Tax=Methanogenium sp. S4BF TaxID=1789226 RepID=UPI002417B7DF|nr:hypothetical protein [Methanogenium sp. S4BF]WFN35251.1 hypothetical protein L1S32_03780 [Methanogenium sp. S4BF]
MTPDISRYVVPPKFGEMGSIIEALILIIKINEKSERLKEVTLFIPTKHQLNGTDIDAALGEKPCKNLSKGKKLKIADNLVLKCETIKTFNSYSSSEIVLCVYPNKKMLDILDSVKNLDLAVVVPWYMDEIGEWKKTWNPIILGEEHSELEDLIKNPVVEEAMKTLTRRVNLSTGLSNPRDKRETVELLRILRNNGELFDPDSLKAWALRNDWKPQGAEELRSCAQAIIERKSLHGNKEAWNPDIINVLRERAYSKEEGN